MTFNQMNLIKPLMRAINEEGFEQPSPIQAKTIPYTLEGKDILGCAHTGTGKTAAFALPIIQNLSKKKSHNIRALVLTPTRELAIQIEDCCKRYGKYTSVRTGVIFGGVAQKPQVKMLREGVDLLIATPGRLNALLDEGYLKLNHLEVLVLDEADRMLDMGFVKDVKKIIKQVPKKRQTLFFSATMPKEIEVLSSSMLSNPMMIKVDAVESTVDRISQSVYYVDKNNKMALLASLIKKDKIQHGIVFTKTKYGADKVVKKLQKVHISSKAIHGDKGQNARQEALKAFYNGDIPILVATDIAARGIDIPEVSHVFNYDLPDVPETYIHRIGRTGRAGANGIAISFCNIDDMENLKQIDKHTGKKMTVEKSKWPMVITEKKVLITEKAEMVQKPQKSRMKRKK